MPTCNPEARALEDRLNRELEEVNARKRKVEEAIRTVDAATNRLIDNAARQDIEAYRTLRFSHEVFRTGFKPDQRLGAPHQDGDARSAAQCGSNSNHNFRSSVLIAR